MSLQIEPQQGIRLDLAHYSKIRAYQGGGEMWEHDSQQLVLQYLGEFLPRAVENPGGNRGTVLFTHLINGRDVLSMSTGLNANEGQPPSSQLARLRDAISQLKAKEGDPRTDPNARKLIAAFRLPDPQKDPELYRLYGSGRDKRLFVLWGVEKERDTALAPQAAVALLPTGGGFPAWLKWLLGLLLLLLLCALVWWLTQQGKEGGEPHRGEPPYAPVVALDDEMPGVARSGADVPTRIPTAPFGAADPESFPNGIANSTPAAPIDSGNPTNGVAPADPGELPGSIAESNAPSVVESPVPRERMAPGAGSPPHSTPQSRPKQADIDRGHAATAVTQNSAPTAGNSVPEPNAEKLPAEPDSPTPLPDDALPPGEDLPPKAPGAESKSSVPPAQETPSPAQARSGVVKLEITNTGTSAQPNNGRVEVVLSAIGRDAAGALVPVTTVKRWTIDGVHQKSPSGTLSTTSALPVKLRKGTHRVVVEGIGANQRPVKAQADVEVGIQVTEKTDVKVRPRP